MKVSSSWTWSDGTPWGHYEKWGPGGPSGDGDCVEMYIDDTWNTASTWNDLPCKDLLDLRFVCQRTATDTPSPSSSCPPPWKEKFGKCYNFFTEKKSWQEAENHCKANEVILRNNDKSTISYLGYRVTWFPFKMKQKINLSTTVFILELKGVFG